MMQSSSKITGAKVNFAWPDPRPQDVLLLKAHSAGVGDLLRSSAAWRVLRDALPQARLHLWFLTKNPGGPSEELIGHHHLLASFDVSNKRRDGWRKLLCDADRIAKATRPQLIVDFEPNGFRTSLLTWFLGRRARAGTVGIAEFPLRRLFYNRAAPSVRSYARRRGMSRPIEYTQRDFVALTALGLERHGAVIELRETVEGRAFREELLAQIGGARPVLGVNVGCGTPDALPKQPNLDLLASLVNELHRQHGFTVVLTGATYEMEINRQLRNKLSSAMPVLDLAGRTNMLELTGAIAACRLFISGDSGPYHMAVALRVPLLALFNFPNPVHYHTHPWVECRVAPGAGALPEVLAAAERLLQVVPPPLPP